MLIPAFATVLSLAARCPVKQPPNEIVVMTDDQG